MSKLEQSARQVLEWYDGNVDGASLAFTALREALAEQAEQEPVAYFHRLDDGYLCLSAHPNVGWPPLYAAPQPITTPDVCGEVCARAKLCYGCGKALDEANASWMSHDELKAYWSGYGNGRQEALAEQAECPHGVDDGACKECYMEQAEQSSVAATPTTLAEPVAIADGTFNHNCPIGTPLYAAPVQQVTRADLKAAFKEGFERAADLYAPKDVPEGSPDEPVKQEPVAWARYPRYTGTIQKPEIVFTKPDGNDWLPLVTLSEAPARTKDLTDDEIEQVRKSFGDEVISAVAFARAVIAAFKEKNAPIQREHQEPVAWALMHKNGLEFNTGYGIVETLQEAEEMQRRHLGDVKIVPLYTTPPSVEAAVLAEPVKQEPVAILKSSKANFERQFGKQVFADWVYDDLTYSFESAAPVSAEAIRAEALEEAAKVCEKAMIQMNYSEAPYKQCAAAIRGLK